MVCIIDERWLAASPFEVEPMWQRQLDATIADDRKSAVVNARGRAMSLSEY